jgi:predicted transcriptional regulator of viral defense system
MKALQWQSYLEEQNRIHDKRLFTVTELANAAGTSSHIVNVQLDRLRCRGVIERYARGTYGLPNAVTAEDLVQALDRSAYITGAAALHRHGIITQVPTKYTCFTNRRHNRSRERRTPVGRFVFVCVKRSVYAPPKAAVTAPPEQALLDFVYVCRLKGVAPRSIVTFRNLERLNDVLIGELAERYPRTVAVEVRNIR